MIAEKIEQVAQLMEALADRDNDDLKLAAPLIADALRAEAERVQGLEAGCSLEACHG